MAVQKSKKSTSRRGMRRSHDALGEATLSTDSMTGEMHRRHQVTATGYYKGKKWLTSKPQAKILLRRFIYKLRKGLVFRGLFTL